jgi:hypothetical protein
VCDFIPLWPVYDNVQVHRHQGNREFFLDFCRVCSPQTGRLALEYGCSGSVVVLETRMEATTVIAIPEN